MSPKIKSQEEGKDVNEAIMQKEKSNFQCQKCCQRMRVIFIILKRKR